MKSARRRGRPSPESAPLDRRSLLDAALAMLEEHGLARLTMRRLADHLGVSPMALYNHVANKQELLRGMAELLLESATFTTQTPSWRDRLLECFRELRRVCLSHPEAVRLLQTMSEPPAAVHQPMQITLAALAETGIEGQDALRAYFLLINFTMGQTAYETGGPMPGVEIYENFPGQIKWDFNDAFEFGLAVIIDGLAHRVTI